MLSGLSGIGLFKVFINSREDRIECTPRKLVTDTKLGEGVNMLEGKAATRQAEEKG